MSNSSSNYEKEKVSTAAVHKIKIHSKTKEGPNTVECEKCGYDWRTRSKRKRLTCPGCGYSYVENPYRLYDTKDNGGES